MLPLCAAEGIGVIPWSPQARGKLSRDWDYSSIRTETDEAFSVDVLVSELAVAEMNDDNQRDLDPLSARSPAASSPSRPYG